MTISKFRCRRPEIVQPAPVAAAKLYAPAAGKLYLKAGGFWNPNPLCPFAVLSGHQIPNLHFYEEGFLRLLDNIFHFESCVNDPVATTSFFYYFIPKPVLNRISVTSSTGYF